MRDFVYVKDCVEVMWWLLIHDEVNGLFNLGSGRARSWNDLIQALFTAMGHPPQIKYIVMPEALHESYQMPEALHESYQYFTQASMEQLKKTGCPLHFRSLEEAVRDYVANHLQAKEPHLRSIGEAKSTRSSSALSLCSATAK